MRRALSIAAVCTVVFTTAALSQRVASFDAEGWRQDVRLIARELPARHPNMFFRLPRARWDSAVAATEQRMGSLTPNQALVALMELVALVRDGHTSIKPLSALAAPVRYYPVEFYLFEDGLFIRSAAPEQAALAGAKVIRIGRVSAEEALAAVGRVLPHENRWWLMGWAPLWLSFAEVVDGLGLVEDLERLPVVVERGGRRETVILRPAGQLQADVHNPDAVIDRSRWTEMRQSGTAAPWRRNPGRPYWVEYLAEQRTLYVCYRAVISVDQLQSNADFWRQVFSLADSLPLERLVLDIRENTGGNSFLNRAVVRGIVARPALDRPDRLFVITGRRTFSAAMNLARDLERWTNATFVGEPTGNSLYFFGDHTEVPLPGSGLALNVSTFPWPPYASSDQREFLAPAIYAPLTSADFRANVDPALRAILVSGSTPPLAERVAAALHRGDSLAATRLVEDARADIANRFRSPEVEVNRLGYQLLNEKEYPPAVAVFRINTRVFPQSANAWDSLADGLIAAGKRDEGIAAYRRALAIDPRFPSSLNALQRLGVATGP